MEALVRRRFTTDFKAQAVALVDSLGQTGAARKLGMSAKTLQHWVHDARSGKVKKGTAHRPASDTEAENARLRAENAELRMERDILKKATAFFAKESR